MRITGGIGRGRRLVAWEEAGIRPMRDFVRTALFNILGELVAGARFLDLFCGTGSVGLEALSRGAIECVFIDSASEACAITRRNLDALSFLDKGVVIQADFAEGIDRLQRRGRTFELVFVGPPYGKGLAKAALRLLGDGRLILEDTIIVIEVYKKEEMAPTYGRLSRVEERVYGDNKLVFYRANEREGSTAESE
jgi:16S rRNA (guanine(966)-N(2))-methyltransferase RsmD